MIAIDIIIDASIADCSLRIYFPTPSRWLGYAGAVSSSTTQVNKVSQRYRYVFNIPKVARSSILQTSFEIDMGSPAKIPSFMFAILIASVAYGENKYLNSTTVTPLLNTNCWLGIAVTLFITSLGTIIRKKRATRKFNLPLVIPSVLVFILATVVRVTGALRNSN